MTSTDNRATGLHSSAMFILGGISLHWVDYVCKIVGGFVFNAEIVILGGSESVYQSRVPMH